MAEILYGIPAHKIPDLNEAMPSAYAHEPPMDMIRVAGSFLHLR